MKQFMGETTVVVALVAGHCPSDKMVRLTVAFPYACADQVPVPA